MTPCPERASLQRAVAALEDEPASVGDTVCNWLAYHPRLTCALICASIYLAFLADRILP